MQNQDRYFIIELDFKKGGFMEKEFIKILREVVKEEINALRQEVVTKEDLKAFATKEDLERLRSEMATKEDLKTFATKEDLKKLRVELTSEIKALRDEMVTPDDLKIYITKEDFDILIKSISERLESFSERALRFFKHYDEDVKDLHRKFELIDFGLLLTHLDRLAGMLEKKEQDRLIAENQLKRQYIELKERLNKLENMISL